MALDSRLIRLDSQRVEVPQDFRPGMNTRGLIYLDEALERGLDDKTIRQVANVASLPGIVGDSLAMPDVHMGYGFTIGGVAAFDLDKGIVSPGGVGYDINCGVRLLRSKLHFKYVSKYIQDLVGMLYSTIPTGVGSKGLIRLNPRDLQRGPLSKGAEWAVSAGYGESEDTERSESGGRLDDVDPEAISDKALERGSAQLGTLGSGNHFVEIQYVDEIFDKAAAHAFGLFQGQVTVMIHTGSRGLGHQVCTDYVQAMARASHKFSIDLPDRELACAPCASDEAREYLLAMGAAANYAWANRQCITHMVRGVFQGVMHLSPVELGMTLLYDVAHNIAKVEDHIVGGKMRKLLVHRKGATRAFAAGHKELPEAYRQIGQPVIIPGDMGRASYVLIGTEGAMQNTWGSTCHGAGRLLSRNQAIKRAKGRAIWRELLDKGIVVRAKGKRTLSEEMPEAYKDISDVVEVVHRAGISRKVARLRPMGVIKG